ncbi:terminase small subunit [Xanthobacter aminoxidans]|uniref:terminase small subunit n=1 Tax=Xanthobacter aminoxidans TaxID=186280 RepID=UPI00372C347E
MRAGYSKRTAAFIGAENLKKPYVAEAIRIAIAERAAKTEITAERVLRELAKIGFANMDSFMKLTPDGSAVLDFSNLTPEQAAAISEITVEEFMDGNGDDARPVRRVKFKLHDKRAALVDIGRHLGMFNDKLTLRGDAENPMTLFVKQMQGTSIQPVEIVPPQEELELRGRH